MTKDQEEQAPQPKSSSQARNWQDLAKRYRAIGIASVAAAVQIFGARDPQPTPQKAAVRYIGNHPR